MLDIASEWTLGESLAVRLNGYRLEVQPMAHIEMVSEPPPGVPVWSLARDTRVDTNGHCLFVVR